MRKEPLKLQIAILGYNKKEVNRHFRKLAEWQRLELDLLNEEANSLRLYRNALIRKTQDENESDASPTETNMEPETFEEPSPAWTDAATAETEEILDGVASTGEAAVTVVEPEEKNKPEATEPDSMELPEGVEEIPVTRPLTSGKLIRFPERKRESVSGFWEEIEPYMNHASMEMEVPDPEILAETAATWVNTGSEPVHGYPRSTSFFGEPLPVVPEKTGRLTAVVQPAPHTPAAGANEEKEPERASRKQLTDNVAFSRQASGNHSPALAREIDQLRKKYVIGKWVGKDLYDPEGGLIASRNTVITEEIMQLADQAGKLPELIVDMMIPGLDLNE